MDELPAEDVNSFNLVATSSEQRAENPASGPIRILPRRQGRCRLQTVGGAPKLSRCLPRRAQTPTRLDPGGVADRRFPRYDRRAPGDHECVGPSSTLGTALLTDRNIELSTVGIDRRDTRCK